MSRRETRVRGDAPATDTPTDAAGRPAGTEHLTLPAVPMTPGYASDGSGRIINDAVRDEAAVRRAYLVHPNPPDDMPTGIGNETHGDRVRAINDERNATRERELLVPTVTTTEVVGEANPTGDGDARTVEIVAATTRPKLGDAGDGEPVIGRTGDAPPVITGATMNTRTVAPEPLVMRDGESPDSPVNAAVAGGSTSALDTFGNEPLGGRTLTDASESADPTGAASPGSTSGTTSTGTTAPGAGTAGGSNAGGGAPGAGTTGIGDGTAAGTPSSGTSGSTGGGTGTV